MKKKLLLSSVAALTLFAAYNAVNAEEDQYGKFGEPLFHERKLPEASSIEKAQTKEELQKLAAEYAERQEAVVALRKANKELKDAQKDEADSKTDFEKAQKAYNDAIEAVKVAMDTQYDASAQKDHLTEVLATVENRLDYDKQELLKKQGELGEITNTTEAGKDAYSIQARAASALAQAEAQLKEHLEIDKPSDGAPLETLKQYESDSIALERVVEQAKDVKLEADKKVKKLEAEVKELKENIQKNEDNKKSLNNAIEQLKVVVGDEGENTENTGKVRGVAVAALQKDADLKYEALAKASGKRIYAANYRKDAEEAYKEKLEAAKEVFKKQHVEFVLTNVLSVSEPTGTFVQKFGWNKDASGNWNYLLDSEGKKATGWVNDNGSWYYLDQAGVMQKWWVQVEGTWYYLNGSGAMQTGWLQDNGTWYYLEASGAMKANQWFEVDGKWYHVNASGALSVNTTVDGYNVNENGEWV